MNTTGKTPSRRTLLALGAGAALAASLPVGGTASAATASASPSGSGAVARRLAELEREHAARLGVYAHDTATGRTVRYRAQERFPLCSVFKTLAVAAVLRDLDRDGEFLSKRVRYTAQEAAASGHAPITGRPENVARGMTVAELSDAAIRFSDNAAANLLLRELGGPAAVTRFARSTGDPTTRLDRWEPDLNSAEPWRVTDTTTPYAIGRTYEHLVLGAALEASDRRLLTGWLLGNTTGGERLRAGLPAGWTVADKTGAGEYGTDNDVAIAWPPGRAPVVIAVLTTKPDPDAAPDDPLIARTAALLATALAGS
ncbi:class A beta-lactamase [Streptomyces sp. NBC_01264]|uniref:class A beta-lactamase n=1 Tax=Streptomyces sp. NBC_01264 TaxID=2903804 RepID=UPI002256F4A9|nr:class A beta-lactamase [Streptomyces sp. NBC_01264]MCX4775626.1 class A beta-lactamase [Streptomyces sp. NBC_01264]